jgi:hypothetical protein
MGAAPPVDSLEILLNFEANNMSCLEGFRHSLLAVTPTQGRVIVLGEGEGVGLVLVNLGSEGFPERLIAPHGQISSDALLQPTPEPTIFFHSLPDSGPQAIPVLRPRLLLEQRIRAFDSTLSEAVKEQFIMEIKAFAGRASYMDDRFTVGTVERILPHVREILRYAEMIFIATTLDEVNEWRELGVPLTEEDVSKYLRMQGSTRTGTRASSISVNIGHDTSLPLPFVQPVRPYTNFQHK